MGYTHYWRTQGGLVIEDETYKKIVEGIKQISATAQEAGVGITEDYEEDEVWYCNHCDAEKDPDFPCSNCGEHETSIPDPDDD